MEAQWLRELFERFAVPISLQEQSGVDHHAMSATHLFGMLRTMRGVRVSAAVAMRIYNTCAANSHLAGPRMTYPEFLAALDHVARTAYTRDPDPHTRLVHEELLPLAAMQGVGEAGLDLVQGVAAAMRAYWSAITRMFSEAEVLSGGRRSGASLGVSADGALQLARKLALFPAHLTRLDVLTAFDMTARTFAAASASPSVTRLTLTPFWHFLARLALLLSSREPFRATLAEAAEEPRGVACLFLRQVGPAYKQLFELPAAPARSLAARRCLPAATTRCARAVVQQPRTRAEEAVAQQLGDTLALTQRMPVRTLRQHITELTALLESEAAAPPVVLRCRASAAGASAGEAVKAAAACAAGGGQAQMPAAGVRQCGSDLAPAAD